MNELLTTILHKADDTMKKAIQHLEAELVKVRAGKATPAILDGLQVDYYGNATPISQVANIIAADARTLTVQPWEKNMLQPIERAIINASLGINPQNDGIVIRLFMPPLTEERRKELVKKSNGEGELTKISIRNIRRDAIEDVKKLQKEGTSEDECKDAEAALQDATNKHITMVEKLLDAKEKEIMTV